MSVCKVWFCLLVLTTLSAQSATCPAARVDWFVKPNGKALTRPAYTLNKDGVRGTKIVERAWVGTQCDLTRPTKPSGKDLYASYDSTGTVALCSKR